MSIVKQFHCLLLICQSIVVLGQGERVRFHEVTLEAGIDFKYTFGDYSYKNILESSGSGITIFDYDGDADMDIYLLNGTYLEGISDKDGIVFNETSNHLYRNNGNGTFTDVTAKAGIGDIHWSMMAGAVDYDNDGDVDLYLLNYGPNVFYRNNGDSTFSDITNETGLQGPIELNGFIKWSVSAAFWDYNKDGLLDVMMGNFLAFDPDYFTPTNPEMMPHPAEYEGQASLLYLQQPNGKFIEATAQAGLFYPDSKCMGLTIFDYDQDGDLDLFQGNDHQPNFMFRNDGGLIYTEVAVASGIAVNDAGKPTGSMHGSVGDVDGDGLVDLLVTDLKHGSMYRHKGNGLYEDVTSRSGLSDHFSGKGAWAAIMFDFDNDGDIDIFSANGTAEELILQYPLLMANDGKGHFSNIGPQSGPYFNEKRSGRGAAVVDYDNDGDLDIIVSHVDLKQTATLLRNDGGNRNHWLGLSLEGKRGAASSIGAQVTVYAGNLTLVRVNQWSTSYLSNNDPRIHFGLGNEEMIDKIEVVWPDGTVETYPGCQANQYISLKQSEGK